MQNINKKKDQSNFFTGKINQELENQPILNEIKKIEL